MVQHTKEYMDAIVQSYKDRGLCITCQKPNDRIPEYFSCSECSEKHRLMREERKKNKLCTICTKPAQPGLVTCTECNDYKNSLHPVDMTREKKIKRIEDAFKTAGFSILQSWDTIGDKFIRIKIKGKCNTCGYEYMINVEKLLAGRKCRKCSKAAASLKTAAKIVEKSKKRYEKYGDYYGYKNMVRTLTRQVIKLHGLFPGLVESNKGKERGEMLSVDHKRSTWMCFAEGFTAEQASCCGNLELMEFRNNSGKREKSSLTPEELIEVYNKCEICTHLWDYIKATKGKLRNGKVDTLLFRNPDAPTGLEDKDLSITL